jgi:hypothetical protein
LSGSTQATYRVAGTFTDDFNRANSTQGLANGWNQVAGNLFIQDNQAASADKRAMHTAVRQGFVGATQDIGARFTSTSNNHGPRFGLLARYTDSKNYYTCYRQTGGSSRLRISKVVNGREKILNSAPIGNLRLGAPFTLGRQVTLTTGATLTLFYNGVSTVMAADAGSALPAETSD